jgi:hypothetical protein
LSHDSAEIPAEDQFDIPLEWCKHRKQREGFKYIHNRAALDQVDGAGGVFGWAFREELKPAP